MKGITGNPVLDAYQRGGVSKVGAAKPAEQAGGVAQSKLVIEAVTQGMIEGGKGGKLLVATAAGKVAVFRQAPIIK